LKNETFRSSCCRKSWDVLYGQDTLNFMLSTPRFLPVAHKNWAPTRRNACTSKREPPCSCMHHSRERLARTSHTRISPALAFPFVIPLHRIFYELSLFWTASGSLPIVSRTPAFCIIVVVKQHYTKHFRYAACGSPVTTCRVLSLGWVKERLQMYSTAASGLTEWAAVDSRQLGVSEVMCLGVILTAPYSKKSQ